MKIKTYTLCLLAALTLHCLPATRAFSQNGVAINNSGAAADSSAMLDISSHNSGILIPRMTTAEKNAIPAPAEGLQIVNITTRCLEIYFLGAWHEIYCACHLSSPSAITGPASLCQNQAGVTYFIPPVNGATNYIWTVPPGSVITSGQGTTTITVTADSIPGNISVAAANSCDTSQSSNLSISITPFPDPPGAITGATTVVVGQTNVPYSVVNIPGITYTWTVPSGASVTSGQGTHSILVNFGSDSGNICVTATNGCGTSSPVCDSISVILCPPGSQTFSYSGSIVNFTVPACVTQITIEAFGAQGSGGNGTIGGKGARMKGDFAVSGGQVLKILVGGQGTNVSTNSSGGGGGTFVTDMSNNPLIIAGGGGGTNGSPTNGNQDAPTTNSGLNGYSPTNPSSIGYGGTAGNGATGTTACAGNGGGLLTNGQNTSCCSNTGGVAFVNGGNGAPGGCGYNSPGGFGGAGGGGGWGSGGGGGYSGGGANYHYPGNAGGGGSYNAGTNQNNTAGVQTGNGQVVIAW